MKRFGIPVLVPALVVLVLLVASRTVPTMDHPPMGTVQRGYRGTGLVHVYNPRTFDAVRDANEIPPSVPYAGDVGEKAGTYYKNVQVLGDTNIGEFTRLMVNMTTWVAPDQGCAACHEVSNFADDTKYQKVVARRMLKMVRHINTDWTQHVAETGVTCYTCHRGQLVPPNVWFNETGPLPRGVLQDFPGKNLPSSAAAGSALALDPFTPYLEQATDIRVQSGSALPADDAISIKGDTHQSIKQAEGTYALMLSMSKSLGVNCDYCHNTRAFRDWSQSPPQRVTAWHGIRMVRELNENYLNPLKSVLPSNRLGVSSGDAPKANCATCHNGAYKPLLGASMVQGDYGFPELKSAAAQ